MLYEGTVLLKEFAVASYTRLFTDGLNMESSNGTVTELLLC